MAIGSKTRVRSSIPQIPERSDVLDSALKLIWVITNRHGIIGGRCALLPPRTMMGIISISPIAVTTGQATSAFYGSLMISDAWRLGHFQWHMGCLVCQGRELLI